MRLDEAARLFMGIPFRHQGRDPLIGLDCIGLVILAGQLCDKDFVSADQTDYGRDPHAGLLEGRMLTALGKPVNGMEPGDIVAIDFKGVIRHVGIVGDGQHGLTLIHTNGHVGRVTEARIDAKWAKRIKRTYRP
jgi:cell wall-associated NlpC family hydrolase